MQTRIVYIEVLGTSMNTMAPDMVIGMDGYLNLLSIDQKICCAVLAE